MQHLVVILDESAPSFCFYPAPRRAPQLMSLDVLRKVVSFAQKRNLLLNFLPGEAEIPASHTDVIDAISHLFIADPRLPVRTPDDIALVDKANEEALPAADKAENIILRVSRDCIGSLYEAVMRYVSDVRRINVHLLDIDLFTQADLDAYREQLGKLLEIYAKTRDKELNILTDRMVLFEMNNCGAGTKHVTVAPDGKLYICPAFYYDDPKSSIGSVDEGILIVNRHLLQLDYAPICRQCDAFHCRRCLWLNQKTTGEVNTPSHEQCVVSHLERNASRALLLRKTGNNNHIPEINYLDPFEK